MTGTAALGAVVTRVATVTGPDRDPLTVIRTGDRGSVDAGQGIATARIDPAPRPALPSTMRRRP
ncbi:hypothetical protein WDA79_10225 [Streptomyces sp. A475]|uniref:hypothetical protein n=1 Tax=Streptomyces sp. A475 TaxID=3131976 RepID=UPI0030C95827